MPSTKLTVFLLASMAAGLASAKLCANYEPVIECGPDNEQVSDPRDCHAFWACQITDTGYSVIKMECPANLVFNDDLKRCDWPSDDDNCGCIWCDDGWEGTEDGDLCYFLSREKAAKYDDAQALCAESEGRLAEPASPEENAQVVAMANAALDGSSLDGRDYWLGGRKVDGEWRWESGRAWDWTNWWGGKPNSAGMGALRGGCIQLLKTGLTIPPVLDNFYWVRTANDKECKNKEGDNGYICEKKGYSIP